MPPRPPKSLRILMIASEAYPFSKSGGLADVATALPRALGRLGHDVTLITPRYRGIEPGTAVDRSVVEVAGVRFDVAFGEQVVGTGARVLLLDCPPLFDRAGLYNEHGADYGDNAVRFGLLAAAAVDWHSRQALAAHIVHAHDWQAGLAPVYLRRHDGGPGAVLTIHNLAYQGVFDKAWVPRLGLSWAGFTVGGFEFHDHLSFLKAGINFSDAVTTVSPTYAEEIQRPEYGYGFDGVIRARREALVGILNGIDTDEWDPSRDRFLPTPYDAADLSGKTAAKRALLEAFGLPAGPADLRSPVVGMVSRMVDQKGLDLIAALSGELPSMATFVILGTGEARYQQMWQGLAAWRPDRVSVHVGYDERRAHLIEAGADIFMMPSRFEPCGLNQMYSMRYGTVPVVRAVGGLVDTVRPYDARNGQGTGFLFSEYSAGALHAALQAALALYHGNPSGWARLQKNGMRRDFSWERSAAEYVKVYKRVLAGRRDTAPGTGI